MSQIDWLSVNDGNLKSQIQCIHLIWNWNKKLVGIDLMDLNTDCLNLQSIGFLIEGFKNQDPYPFFLVGSEFQKKVWCELTRIPIGQTRTYSQIAETIGQPKAVRAVANAIAKNPYAILVPCHRVLPKSSRIGNYRWGPAWKKRLLQFEFQLYKR